MFGQFIHMRPCVLPWKKCVKKSSYYSSSSQVLIGYYAPQKKKKKTFIGFMFFTLHFCCIDYLKIIALLGSCCIDYFKIIALLDSFMD